MSEAFRNNFSQKVDGKARVSIPAAFRRVLEAGDPNYSEKSRPRVALVFGDETRKFLECYTIAGMRRLERRINRMHPGDPRRIYLTRNVTSLSAEVEIDDDGRIVLPPRGRDKLGLGASKEGVEAVFAGTLDTFQIWSTEGWAADLAAQAAIAKELLAPGQDMMSLLPEDDEPEE